jgi:Flp pilus assembly protein TadG
VTSGVLPRLRSSRSAECGNAIVEFHFLGLLLLVPLVYILLAVLDVQRASYGVTQAAREAARVYSVSGDEGQAQFAARVALDDQRITQAATVDIVGPYAPGSRVTVTVDTAAALPFIPDALAAGARAQIPVSARTVVIVDRYRST